jgi:hypothetical protein
MGFCLSLCNRDNERPDPESRFPILEICQRSDSDSDPALKAKATTSGNRDVAPLLEGPTLLSLREMQLSTDSSADEERNRIAAMLHPTEDLDGPVAPQSSKGQADTSSRTFPNVPPGYTAGAASGDTDALK